MRRLVLIVAVPLLTGCASIIHGSQQDVSFTSNPSSATVTIDGNAVGTTPIVYKLSRKQLHVVRFTLDGYQPYEITLSRSISGWVAGNILFGGLIGLAVDAGTGALYKLTPEQVTANLPQKVASSELPEGGLAIAVVMAPDPSWEQIGQLRRR